MKKTISVNIKGMNFLIEEGAYEQLSNYLDRLAISLKDQKGSQEVIEDVELRVAELCSMRLTDKKQVIELADIEEILQTLGQPEDYADENLDDTMEQVDYSQSNQSTEKRLYRDEENARIGGVCAGISNYLGIDVVIVRAIFLIVFIFGGFGLPLYIILWIIIPKAKTTIERLRMKGRPITLESVREEVDNAAKRIKKDTISFRDRFKSNNDYNNRLNSIGRVISVIAGIVLIAMGISFLMSFLFLALDHMEFIPIDTNKGNFSITDFFALVLSNDTDFHFAYACIMVVTFCTTLFLLLAGASFIFRLRNGWTRITLGSLFGIGVIGVIACTYIGMKTAKDFSTEGEIERTVYSIETDQLNVVPSFEKMKDFENFKIRSNNLIHQFKIEGDDVHASGINVEYRPSKDSSFHVLQNFVARGESHKAALYKAKNILHELTLTDDNKLEIPTSYHYPALDKLRGQEVSVIIEVPAGRTVLVNNEIISLDNPPAHRHRRSHRYMWQDGHMYHDGHYEHWD